MRFQYARNGFNDQSRTQGNSSGSVKQATKESFLRFRTTKGDFAVQSYHFNTIPTPFEISESIRLRERERERERERDIHGLQPWEHTAD